MNHFRFIIYWLIGWLFLPYQDRFLKRGKCKEKPGSLSIIIPAMNEEQNIAKVLNSLFRQTYQPHEIIVINDHSTDQTEAIVSSYPGVKIISLQKEPPEGWVGKPWACWNGYLNASNDLLLFLDADVELSGEAVESLMAEYTQKGGLISVWPYQRLERIYEHLNMPFNLIAHSLLSSFFFFHIPQQPALVFGPVILTSRRDYEKIGGHRAVKNRIVEDIDIGKVYAREGINITSFFGGELIRFRMYPEGFKQLWEGLTKNIASGAIRMNLINFIALFLWFIGIYSSFLSVSKPGYYFYYPLYALQIYLLVNKTGDYNVLDAVLFPGHFLFFLIIFLVSLFKKFILKSVTWKGRKIDV